MKHLLTVLIKIPPEARLFDYDGILGQIGFSNYGPVNTTVVLLPLAKNGFVLVYFASWCNN